LKITYDSYGRLAEPKSREGIITDIELCV